MNLVRVIAALLIWPAVVGSQGLPDKRLMDTANSFAEEYNEWAEWLRSHSPYSPDFPERCREEWDKREMSQRFRRLESELRNLEGARVSARGARK